MVRLGRVEIVADLAPLAFDRSDAWSRSVAPALKDEAPAVRMKAAQALGLIGESSALPDLEGALGDPDLDVRLCAVQALGRIGDDRAQERLLNLLKAPEPLPDQMQVEAEAALVRISQQHDARFLGELLAADEKRRDYALQKLIELLGHDFGYKIDASPRERDAALERIKAALKDVTRPIRT